MTIGGELSAAVEGTRMFGPGPVPVIPDTDRFSVCEVTGESSPEAARRLPARDPAAVAVLDVASALCATLLRAPGVLRTPRRGPQPLLLRPGDPAGVRAASTRSAPGVGSRISPKKFCKNTLAKPVIRSTLRSWSVKSAHACSTPSAIRRP
ncbi:hypothetical protein ABZ611_33295 [Streptomyces sp. NPDC007861]|uniref:hypothetical protein n=1 Tax=Streptomyces sp. NPDC007861 TaxID=3154893 RepID=UPI0033F24778